MQRTIVFHGHTIAIRMMDDRCIVSDCPQEPTHYEVLKWRNSTLCAGMGISGTPVREVTAAAREQYGNCAVLAWDGDVVVGILTFSLSRICMSAGRTDGTSWNPILASGP